MKHFGDITQIHGYDLPIVDVITGGSPCQDLSVAGKRAGLQGERSGLFMEQMRIVKEMREHDERTNGRTGQSVRPRHLWWENVPGAFSSGSPKGADFQAVLQEVCRVVVKEAPPVPIPDKGWPSAGCLTGVGDDGTPFSIAWRVHSAEFWGMAQRRKRVSLVADFGGLSAPEICFERESMPRDSGESQPPRKGAAPGITDRAGRTGDANERVASTITATYGTKWNGNAGAYSGGNFAIESADRSGGCLNPWDVQSKHIQRPDGVAESLYSGERRGGCGESYVLDDGDGDDSGDDDGESHTDGHELAGLRSYTLKVRGGVERDSHGRKAGKGALVQEEMSGTLGVSQDQTVIAFTQNQRDEVRDLGDMAGGIAAESGSHQQTYVAVDVYNQTVEGEIAPTVTAAAGGSNTSGPKVLAYGIDQQGGKGGANYTVEVSPTVLSDSHGTPHAVAYGICSYGSNAMLSSNPHSGVYRADTSRTLDLNGGDPSCHQGGMAIVYPMEGNGARPSHQGSGFGDAGDPEFTLNHVEVHGAAVTYDARGNGDGQTVCTLTGDHQDRVTDYTGLVIESDAGT